MKIPLRLNFGIAAADVKHCVHFLYHHCFSGLKVFVYRTGSCSHVVLLGRLSHFWEHFVSLELLLKLDYIVVKFQLAAFHFAAVYLILPHKDI
jgi:hypothetical protein